MTKAVGAVLGGPSLIESDGCRFLITERPKERTLPSYIEELKKYQVTDLVRVCEPSYTTDRLKSAGIKVHDWSFEDGGSPPVEIIDQWLYLIQDRFVEKPGSCIALHCVAGLGRAPVLVAVALIEHGMNYEEAISYIRARRRGAFNTNQIAYLERYKRRCKPKKSSDCVVM